MPNHITNVLTTDVNNDEVWDFLKSITTKDGYEYNIDFNKIVPQPTFEDDDDDDTAPNWYLWRITHWGTKWSGYWCEFDGYSLRFSTAWNSPNPIIHALSKKFPNVEFMVRYYDEDYGHNLGMYAFKNGELTNQYMPPEGTKEAHEFLNSEFGLDTSDMGYEFDE